MSSTTKTPQINSIKTLPKARYVAVLKRMREAIATEKAELEANDCAISGMKSTSASWGLCHESSETWPDAQDHQFPADFEKFGRMSQLRRKSEDKCPLDRRELSDKSPNGCFYTCLIFSPKKSDVKLTREQVINFYDNRITEVTGI